MPTPREMLEAVAGLSGGKGSTPYPPAPNTPSKLYRPGLLEDFLGRLRTYHLRTYMDKPSEISPAECARHGWVNVGMDEVGCLTCGARLYMRAGDGVEDEEGEEDMDDNGGMSGDIVKMLHEELTRSHGEACPWRERPSSSSLYALPQLSVGTTVADYVGRVGRLKRRVEAWRDHGVKLVTKLPPQHLSAEDAGMMMQVVGGGGEDGILEMCAQLALYGWEAGEGEVAMVGCGWCFRTMGLWEEEGDGDRDEDEGVDALLDHRPHCVWRAKGHGWEHVLEACRRHVQGKNPKDVHFQDHSRLAGPVAQVYGVLYGKGR